MTIITPESAQALLDRYELFTSGKESMVLSVSETVDYARTVIAQAAEITRLQAKVDAAEKLVEVVADTADMLLTGEIPDGMFEDDAPDFNRGYDAAIRKVRAALSAYEEAKK